MSSATHSLAAAAASAAFFLSSATFFSAADLRSDEEYLLCVLQRHEGESSRTCE